MRIAVATDDGRMLAAHTGRCRGVVVFDVEGGAACRVEERINTFTAHARGECASGHGDHRGAHAGHDAPAGHAGGAEAHATSHHSHDGLLGALADCRVLITRGMGPRLVADLSAHGIDPFVSLVEDVDEAASLFARGQLPRAPGTGCSRHS